MFEAVGLFVLGLVLLALGGDSLVKGSSGLGRRLGLSPFNTGLLLVAFGTSLPELAVNLRAVMVGSQDLALGNAVGSNVVNFGLTLGAAALAAPLLIRWRSLAPMLLVLAIATVAVMLLGRDGVLTRLDGGLLLLGFVALLGYLVVDGRRASADVRASVGDFATTSPNLALNLVRVAIAAALLWFGARWIVQAAPVIGVALGMAPLLSGLLVVAIGTALPEVAAAIAAARRGQGDLVAGHVIGSSLFNLLVVLGGMASLRALPLPASFVRFELPAALAFALVLYPMLRGDLRIGKGEGGFLLAGFVAWLLFELLQLR